MNNVFTLALGIFLGELGIYLVRNGISYVALKRYYRKQNELMGKLVRPARSAELLDDENLTVN